MSELAKAWSEALPDVRNAVTGVGVWTALNTSVPVALDDDVFVLGVPHESSELAGHLRLSSTRVLIERAMSQKLGRSVALRVIEGVSVSDWETVKRRDTEARRLQEAALERQRAEVSARSNWESVYEQITRRYASTPNKSLPQNRAGFFKDAIEMIVEARKLNPIQDDLAERNYARCLERVAQYSEVPSVLVAVYVSERFGD